MAIFDDAKSSLENPSVSVGTTCLVNTESIRIGCRNAMIAWTTYLESLSSRKPFEEELETKTKALIGSDGSVCRNFCPWLKKVAKTCKDGLKIADSILFATYLEGGNCEAQPI